MGWFSGNTEWAIFNCRHGDFRTIEMVPFVVGCDSLSDFQVPSEESVKDEHFQIDVEENGTTTLKALDGAKIKVNGNQLGTTVLNPKSDYLIQ